MKKRRLVVRLALLFAVVQAVAVAAVVFALPTMQGFESAPMLTVLLLAVDLALLVIFSGWIISASVETSVGKLAQDVQRIGHGDYHHRVSDPVRPEFREIQQSVNRLADRLIADQQLLAENIESLEKTNRELRRARDQVVQTARMASVGTLAAGIAHEVGNPLGAVMGFVDVARARAIREGGDPEILDSIRSEAERIDRIVRGLLDYARPTHGAGDPAPAQEVVGRVREILDSQGALDGIDVTWAVDVPWGHLVDQPRRLEQVLINLLLNARDAVADVHRPTIGLAVREEDGVLTGLPRRREDDPPGINYMHRRRRAQDEDAPASVDGADRVTVIEVADNGHGIDEAAMDQLFDPFFTTKDPGEGTGLGLSICARLLEGMGGRIDAESLDGEGARFVIRLPVLYDIGEEDVPDTSQRVRS
ncbi:MAG: HAMP domain-containing protein [Gemmatimonadetes bacterium]|nr:HAMP domain-containing protein [Gemmatimonadota bacterium]NNL29631.1 HAMP domain-containing protein [Gemmatimonadota bacterium]